MTQDMELVKQVAAAIETRNTDAISLAKRIIGMVQPDNQDVASNVQQPYTEDERKYASVQDEQNTGIVKDPDVAYGNGPVSERNNKVDKRRKTVHTK